MSVEGMAAVARTARESLEARAKESEARHWATLKFETHRLLRAVAIKRAANAPAGQPSIGAVVEDLVERCRGDLEREAGALFKRELAKKR
jgi:hypothetical protein